MLVILKFECHGENHFLCYVGSKEKREVFFFFFEVIKLTKAEQLH